MSAPSEKRSIKIIKRKELARLDEQGIATANHSKTELQSRREIVATIASWIDERRQVIKALPRLNSSAF